MSLTAPVTGCLAVSASSSLRNEAVEFQVTAGIDQEFVMSGLPLTALTLEAKLYAGQLCSGTPLYTAQPATVFLSAEAPSAFHTLRFIGNGGLTLDGSFEDCDEMGGCGPNRPNLVAVSMCGEATASPGSRLLVDVTLRNDGLRASPPGTGSDASGWFGGYYLSNDQAITRDDLYVGGFTTQPSLSPGQVYVVDDDGAELPAMLATGTYFLGLILDPTALVNESNEADNAVSHCAPIVIE